MRHGRLLSLLIGTALLAPALAFGQQAEDPWGGLRANGAPAAPRTVAPARPPAASVPAASAPAATAPAATSASRAVQPATAARPTVPAPAASAATPPRPPVAAAAPLPPPRPAEAPPRPSDVAAVPDPAADPADVAEAPTGAEDAPTSAEGAEATQAAEAPAAPPVPIDPIAAAAAAARSETTPPRMPSLPGDSPLAAAAYGIMSVFAPISEAAAAVPPVAPSEVASAGALPRTEARVMDVDPRAGTPAVPVAPAPVVLPSMVAPAEPVPAAASASPAPQRTTPVAPAPVAPAPIAAAPVASAASAIPVAAPEPPAPSLPPAPQPAAPPRVALANPASVMTPPAPALGKVEASPGSVRAPLWPQDLVRALRRAQDSMAQGSAPALEAQRTLIARIEQEFATADASTWQDPHNARAAVTYFLSGGNPAILRRMMDMQPPPAVDPRLLRGTLAYLEGREEESLRQLKDIDARNLPPSLGGQVAMAQAALYVRKEPAKSAHLLAVARLLAPGTLVEEAALRRAILIASQMGDAAQFEYLSKQYLFRFRNSVYAGNFRQRFAAALSRIGFGNDPAQFRRLDAMLDMLEPDSRREMELTVARAAVVQGLTTTANFAADRALASLPDGSDEAERAKLYRGASMAANPNTYKEALNDLGAIDKDRLAPSDAALLAAASATAETVRRATESPPALAPKAAQTVGPLTKDEMLPVMDRARAAINNADAMLKGTAR